MKFKVGDIVDSPINKRKSGIVKYIACSFAVGPAESRQCNKKECKHENKTHVWVVWEQGGTTYVYLEEELQYAGSIPTNVVDKFKEMVAAKESSFDWDTYNGFSSVKYNKYGQAIKKESFKIKPIIEEKDINWNKYHGFTK